MKLSQLLQIAPSLQALGAMKLPVKVAFRVGTALTNVKPVMATFDEARMKLFQEHGTLGEDGQTYTVPAEKVGVFNEQFSALTEEDCTVTLPKIKLSEMGDVSIEPQHLAALSEMFVDE